MSTPKSESLISSSDRSNPFKHVSSYTHQDNKNFSAKSSNLPEAGLDYKVSLARSNLNLEPSLQTNPSQKNSNPTTQNLNTQVMLNSKPQSNLNYNSSCEEVDSEVKTSILVQNKTNSNAQTKIKSSQNAITTSGTTGSSTRQLTGIKLSDRNSPQLHLKSKNLDLHRRLVSNLSMESNSNSLASSFKRDKSDNNLKQSNLSLSTNENTCSSFDFKVF